MKILFFLYLGYKKLNFLFCFKYIKLNMNDLKTIFENHLISNIIFNQLKFDDQISLLSFLNPNNFGVDVWDLFSKYINIDQCEHLPDGTKCVSCNKMVCYNQCVAFGCNRCTGCFCAECVQCSTECSECGKENCGECMTICLKCTIMQCTYVKGDIDICSHDEFKCTDCNILRQCMISRICSICNQRICMICMRLPNNNCKKICISCQATN